MLLNTRIGGPVKYLKDKETICLTNDKTRHMYIKVEWESIVIVDTIKWEIEDIWGRINTDEEDVNQYHEIDTNNIYI